LVFVEVSIIIDKIVIEVNIMVDVNTVIGSIGSAVPVIAGSKLFTDFASPAVKEAGELGRRLFKGVFAGAYHWADRREKKFQELQDDVLENLEGIDPSRIIAEAPTHVIAPAVMAWSYSMDNRELRAMYAKLLANSSIIDKQELIHPSFVEIIKQLHPSEASLFNLIYLKNAIPLIITRWADSLENVKFQQSMIHISFTPRIIEIKVTVNPSHSGKIPIFSNPDTMVNPAYIENLSRLSLISITYEERIEENNLYEKILQLPEVKKDIESCNFQNKHFISVKGLARITPLGNQFAQTCFLPLK